MGLTGSLIGTRDGARHPYAAICSCAVWLIVSLPAIAAELSRLTRTEPHMGVEFEIVLYADDKAAAEAAIAAAFQRIAELDKALSDYSLDSELSKLSAAAPTLQPLPLGDDLFSVLQASQALAMETDGAFDVTVGPLTKLWRRARRQKELPTDNLLKEAFASVGYKNLIVDEKQRTASLKVAKMRLDLGGIAKGYAADEALKVITAKGISRALVRASGDIAAGDPPPGQTGWKIGLAPLNPNEEPATFILLKRQAISTSGDARQHLIVNGRRYSHLIDPRTGQPMSGRTSVTVIAPRGLESDSLDSAIAILGPEKGLKLIENHPGTSAFIITADDNGGNVRTYASKQFRAARD